MAEPGSPFAEEPAALQWLWGARVQRVDGPLEGLFVLTLYERKTKQHLLLSALPQRLGVGTVSERPTGQSASAFVRRLRVAVENGQLSSAHWLRGTQGAPTASALALRFFRKGEQLTWIVDFDAQHPNLFLLDEAGHIQGAADERARRARFPERKPRYVASPRGKLTPPETPEASAVAGAALLAGRQASAHDALRAAARNQAKTALKRVQRRVAAIQGDLERALSGPRLRAEGNALLCHLREVPSGARTVSLLDESCEPPQPLTIELDPALSAQQNAERKFSRARRLERGLPIARERLAQAQAEAERLARFLSELPGSAPEALEEQAAQLQLSPTKLQAEGKRPGPQVRIPYRSFEGSGGHSILVGKGAADNDTLTLTVARPHDIWLHARNLQGAHVIVPKERTRELPSELLIDAAHLAAHFSDARGDAVVEVQHTERRYLRKPKGSAPGSVRVDRERVLLLRVEPERLKRLLASERQT